MLHPLFAFLAICCGLAALICVSIWAKDPHPEAATSYTNTYLGEPKWENEYFPAYHPVLMVAGFYFAQVLGICMWSIIPEYSIAKLAHVCFMLAAIGTMIAGLYAVVSYEQKVYIPSLTSMHSWVGVMTIIIFGCQVVGGMVLGTLASMGPVSDTVKHLAMIHRGFGLTALFMTTVAILTGIQNYLMGPTSYGTGTGFTGTCGYVFNDDYDDNYNKNPAAHFLKLPPGCRLAYGIGILVILGTMLTGMAAYARAVAIIEQAEVINESQQQVETQQNYEMVEKENREKN
jgi:hypothetical protein